ncbi:MAG: MYXO-CTERM sorting domain-containing protein, partial [Proteobacteria bacterium]|nr:MYXO-CTERM sorting domain-containing protein [Pseudomonadota bacterium]
PLAAPVGRATCGDATCDGDETEASCPADCTTRSGSGMPPPVDEPAPTEVGGCATAGGAGAWIGIALFGLGRRRRRHA